jgi:hypothetical protein
MLIAATEGVMDCDATCLATGQASQLLNLIGFLGFAVAALWAAYGAGGGGHHRWQVWAGVAHLAFAPGA